MKPAAKSNVKNQIAEIEIDSICKFFSTTARLLEYQNSKNNYFNMKNKMLFTTLLLIFVASGCSKETTTAIPDPTTDIVNKWWCSQSNNIAAQYFRSDGTWEQGSKTGRFNDTGTWALSTNKKKIIISNVLDSNKKSKTGWEYDLNSASGSRLLMTFAIANLTMDMAVCP